MPAGKRKDPYKNFRFLLEIDDITQAGFREVTVPDSTQDPIEYREGNEPITARKLPGLIKYGNVSLKWGITDSFDLYDWRKMVEDGNIKKARKNAARWEFSQAWPTKYDAPDLNATANEIAIETLEIAHEKMERIKQ